MAKVGTTVGRINVKVFPDTSDFRKRLEDQLNSIERGLLVTIDTELDTSKLDEQAKRAVETINSKARRKFKDYTVEFGTALDTKGLVAEANRAAREADAQRESELFRVRFDPNDFSDINNAIAQVDEKLKDRRRVEIEVEVKDGELEAMHQLLREQRFTAQIGLKYDPDDIEDTRRVLQELDRIALEERRVDLDVTLQNIDEVRDKLRNVVEEFDGKQIALEAEAATLVARAELARVARDRMVNLFINVNKVSLAKASAAIAALSGGRLISSTLDNLREMFQNLDKNIPLIGSIALAVAGLSSWLLAAASNAFALSRSLAQMFGAALALPGILTGMVVGVSAMVAVFKDFNSELPEIKQGFKDLQNYMSVQFWARVREPMRELAQDLMPQLRRGLIGTSGALGTFFASLAASLKQNLSGSLPAMFRNLNDSIAISAGYTDAMAQNIEVLGRRGSEYLPRLAQWWGELNEKISVWLRMNSATGRLQGFIDLGIFQIREFGRAARGFGSVLAGVARAAEKAGGSTLSILADTLESMADTVNGARFQTGLTDALIGAHEAMSAIAHRSGPAVKAFFLELATTANQAFVTAGNAIGSLLDGIAGGLGQRSFQDGLLAFFEGIRVGIDRLVPAFGPMAEALGRIGELAGNLAVDFGPLLASLFTHLSGAVLRLAPSIERLVSSLSELLLDVLTVAGPAIVGMADAFAAFAANIPAPALLLGLAAGFVALKVAMAGFWVAKNFQNISAAIDATTLAMGKFRAQHTRFVGSVGKVGKAAGIAGAALLALGVASTLSGAFDRGQIASVQQFNTAITDLGKGLEEASEGLQNISTDQVLNGLFAIRSTSGWLPRVTVEISDLRDALDWANASEFERAVLGIGEALGMIENPVRLSGEAIANFDAAMAQAVNSGNLKEAESALKLFVQQAVAAGMSLEEANRLLPAYRDATLAVAQAQQKAHEEAARTAANVKAYNDAIAEVSGLSPGAVQGINDASKAFIDLSEGLDDAELSLHGWIKLLEEQVQAQVAWADNMAELSQRGISDALRQELESLGPAGARFVQDLVDMGDGAADELARLEEIVRMKGEGAAGAAESSFGQISAKVRAAISTLPADVQAELEKAIPGLTNIGDTMAKAVGAGFKGQEPWLTATVDGVVVASVPEPDRIGGIWGSTGTAIGAAIAAGIEEREPLITATVDGVVVAAVPDAEFADIFADAAANHAGAYAGGFTRKSFTVRSAGQAAGNAGVAGVNGTLSGWKVAGIMAVAGLSKGIYGNLAVARAAGNAAGEAALGAAQNKLLIKSPSRAFMELGYYSVLGLAEGLGDVRYVTDAASGLADAVLRGANQGTDLFTQGAEVGRSYAAGIESMTRQSELAAEALRGGLDKGLGEDLSMNLSKVNSRISDGRGTQQDPMQVVLADGTEMTLMVDGQPMRAFVRTGVKQELDGERRDLTGRRGGY